MLFNSYEFMLFFPLVFLGYWFLFQKKLWVQNIFVVAVSYLFYGWWDWRFLLLIALTSAASYWSGILIEKHREKKKSKIIAATNIVLNLLILCLFKYFNFFSENLNKLFDLFGAELDWVTLDILLPVGISFYTFQALSYTIDVYKQKIEPTHDLVSFFAYVSFFPQLVAGPIERATNLLPQFHHKRTFDYANAVDGLRQVLWGFFKKIVIADACALKANLAFEHIDTLSASSLLIGALMFTIQIYCDFSGYSDIAIGTSKLFGINLMRNFNFPYFSRDIAEFWRRWHISLTTWFRDYIYIPLGGSRGTKWESIRNTFIIFLVSGFWHGANWTFLAWGAYHALLFLPLLLLNRNRSNKGVVAEGRLLPSLKELVQMGITFLLVLIGWIIFRAENITQAFEFISALCSKSLFTSQTILSSKDIEIVLLLIFFFAFEWVQRTKQHALQLTLRSKILRYGVYFFVLFWVIVFASGKPATFIYFQF